MSHRVDIYADDTDCTNGGVTSVENRKGKWFRLLTEGEEVPTNPNETRNTTFLRLKQKTVGGTVAYRYCVPIIDGKDKLGMMGGNFAYSCDSRFCQNVNAYPIPIHDRFE